MKDQDAYILFYARDDPQGEGQKRLAFELSDDEAPSPKRRRPSDGRDDDDNDSPFVPSDATDDEDEFGDDESPEDEDENEDDPPSIPSDATDDDACGDLEPESGPAATVLPTKPRQRRRGPHQRFACTKCDDRFTTAEHLEHHLSTLHDPNRR